MSGVSVGWFQPEALYADTPGLVRAIRKMLKPRLNRTRAWPLAVSSIRWRGKGTGVAYAMVGGAIPIHIDTVGLDDSDGRIFQFVLEVENRPGLLVVNQDEQNTPKIVGFAPPTEVQTFAMGVIELKVGMAVHFDITTSFHGITGLPVPMESMKDDLAPKAVIVQVAGFDREDIQGALTHAAFLVAADVGASS